MLDCSQSVPHLPVDVADLDVDFIAFTGHKMLGPTGIGVLWGRSELLDAMPPFLGGGSMIETVTMARLDLRAAAGPVRGRHPADRRGGRPGRGGGLPDRRRHGARSHGHEKEITAYALEALADRARRAHLRPGRRRRAAAARSRSRVDGVHPHDVGQILDAAGC